MGFVIVFVFFGTIALVSTKVSTARTAARKSSNASVRRSLEVQSSLPAAELSSFMSSSLGHAGAVAAGSFDGTSFFRVRKTIELHMTVEANEHGSRATVFLPGVRTVAGRQQNLAPVGRVLELAARAVRERDATATIN